MPSVSSGSSQSTSSGSSSSAPTLVNNPASDYQLQLAQILGDLGKSQYQWALDQYNKTGAVSDANITNYLNAAQQGENLTGNLLGRYENVYQPLEDQYIREAATYASPERQHYEMGKAEAGAGQAGNAARINAERTLQGYGIDPSSGRYQELEMANRAQTGASQAAAGQHAYDTTRQTGINMLQNAVAAGQQIPGQVVNSLNAAMQGLAGSENTNLGQANTGVNLTTSAAPYYGQAMQVRPPPVGQTSSSQNQGQSTSQQQSSSGTVLTTGGGGGGSSDPFGISRYGTSSPQSSYYPDTNSAPTWGVGPGAADQSSGNFDWGGMGGGGGGAGIYNNPYADNSYNSNQGWDESGFNNVDWGNYNYDTSGGGDYGGGVDYSSVGSGGDTGSTDYGSGDFGGYSYGDYAEGGGVLPTTGGGVSPDASPSQGAQVDDVPARLNAGEFVIPRDVAMWKGQEFFQKLIQQSRKARVGAPAHPTSGPAPTGQPTFVSQQAA